MGVPNSPPGAAALPKHFDGPHRKEQWWGFIANADYFGLPVNMLKAVGKSYSFGVRWTKGPPETDVYFNKINLQSASDYDELVHLKYGSAGVASILSTAYHEGSHAYLDLKEDDPRFKTFVADGLAHYKGAPMEDGTACKDEEELLTEAVACYVGERAQTWWIAFEMLARLTAEAEGRQGTPETRRVNAQNTRNTYNKNNQKSQYVYGYIRGGNAENNTTRPMTAAIRVFADKEFLEGRIPDEFDSASRLVPLYQALLSG
jgi:hypothetical protein